MGAAVPAVAQRLTWLLGQLLRLRFALRLVHADGEPLRRRPGEPLVLAPTHEHLLDPWLILSSLDYRTWRGLTPVRALGTQEWTGIYRRLSWLLRGLYRLYGVVALPPRRLQLSREEKLRGLIDALRRGEVVAIFPEGHVREPGEPPVRPFEPGVAVLHRRTGARVVPMAVRVEAGGRWRRRVEVTVGRPMALPGELDVEEAAEWLSRRVQEIHPSAPARTPGP